MESKNENSSSRKRKTDQEKYDDLTKKLEKIQAQQKRNGGELIQGIRQGAHQIIQDAAARIEQTQRVQNVEGQAPQQQQYVIIRKVRIPQLGQKCERTQRVQKQQKRCEHVVVQQHVDRVFRLPREQLGKQLGREILIRVTQEHGSDRYKDHRDHQRP